MSLVKDLSKYHDTGLLILRLVVAGIFLNHGILKMGLWAAAPDTMSPGMLFIMKLLSIAEPLAALGLILGFLTQAAALGIIAIMVSAIYSKLTNGSPLLKNELEILLLAASIMLLFEGPGCHSLDCVWGKKKA